MGNAMGGMLDKPKTEKTNEKGEGNGIRYGVTSMQGWRSNMEDSHTALAKLEGNLKEWSFFGVFDGHAGPGVSEHCSEYLLNSIMQEEQFKSLSVEPTTENVATIKEAIRNGFLRLDDVMRTMPKVVSGDDKSGTTAVCSLISPKHIYVANCGDSRAVLHRKSGIGFSTEDHKPINPCEKERIQNAGGSVLVQRINGSLAVSRALGDFEYKNVVGMGQCEQLVSPEPELYVEQRTGEDEFLVLACDGVWDVMSNEDVCTYIKHQFTLTSDVDEITARVIDTCFSKGSRDNMSIMIVAFENAPKVDPEAVAKDKALNTHIEAKVTELCGAPSSEVSLRSLMESLEDERLSTLPPGGGLPAKQEFVSSILKRLRPEVSEESQAAAHPLHTFLRQQLLESVREKSGADQS